MSWGPLIFGHAPPRIIQAVTEAAARGTSFGASTEAEVRLAQKIVAAVPSVEKVRLVNSGTEAVMSAVRLARGFTKRDKIIKFEGNYHGHSDGFLAKAGSGLTTFDLPDSAGVPANLTRDTLTLPYNDADAFREAMRAHPGEIACVMLEPVAGNMGVVTPRADFLHALRELTAADGALLLFDEVITGFRLAYGGAQELFGITPDLTALGKIIGGGLPLAAYGGRADIMDTVAPVGPVYQAGTLSGNPLAVAAGLAQLTMLDEQKDTLYTDLHHKMHTLAHAAKETAARLGIPHRINRLGSMMTLFFTDAKVVDFATRQNVRHRPLRRLLPGAAGARRLLRAVAVRGGVPQRGAHGRAAGRNRRRPSPRRCMSWLDIPRVTSRKTLTTRPSRSPNWHAPWRDVALTNRLFGGTQTILFHVARLLRDVPAGSRIRILDIATGSADIPARPAGLGPAARPGPDDRGRGQPCRDAPHGAGDCARRASGPGRCPRPAVRAALL